MIDEKEKDAIECVKVLEALKYVVSNPSVVSVKVTITIKEPKK